MFGRFARRLSLGGFGLGIALLQFWGVKQVAVEPLDDIIAFGALIAALSGLTYLAWTLRH